MNTNIPHAKRLIHDILHHDNFELFKKAIKTNFLNDDEKALYISKLFSCPILGYGKFRIVLDIQDFAVKLPFIDGGENDNLSEKNVWESLSLDAKKYFCPFIFSDDFGFVSVFKKTQKFHSYSREFKNDILDELYLLNVEVEDLESPEQWGVLNGRAVILDYSETFIFD